MMIYAFLESLNGIFCAPKIFNVYILIFVSEVYNSKLQNKIKGDQIFVENKIKLSK